MNLQFSDIWNVLTALVWLSIWIFSLRVKLDQIKRELRGLKRNQRNHSHRIGTCEGRLDGHDTLHAEHRREIHSVKQATGLLPIVSKTQTAPSATPVAEALPFEEAT